MRNYFFECYMTNKKPELYAGRLMEAGTITGWEIEVLEAQGENLKEARAKIKQTPFFDCEILFLHSQEIN